MINAQRQRVEQEMTSLVDNLDKSHLRKMQVNSIHAVRSQISYEIFIFDRVKCISARQSAVTTRDLRWRLCKTVSHAVRGQLKKLRGKHVFQLVHVCSHAEWYFAYLTLVACLTPGLISCIFFRYVQSELERVQGRLQRCVMDCNDSIKDRMPANPSETEVAKYTGEFERCAIKVSADVD